MKLNKKQIALMNALNLLYLNDCLDDNTYNWIEEKIKEVKQK